MTRTTTSLSRNSLLCVLSVVAVLLLRPATAGNYRRPWLHQPHPSGSSCTAAGTCLTIPRGGGWFGLGGKNRKRNGDDGSKDPPKKYPALTRSEIEAKLNVPVYGVVSERDGIAVGNSPDQGDVVYFFLSRPMAEQALQTMQASNPELNLRLSTLHLGKLWFEFLEKQDDDDDDETKMTECTPLGPDSRSSRSKNENENSNAKIRKKVNFRLVAGARDFFLARLLTSLSPLEAEELRIAVQEDAKDRAKEIVEKATADCKQFVSPYNEIPLFMMPQLRVQLQPQESDDDEADNDNNNNNNNRNSGGTANLPVFFCAQDLVKAYLNSNSNAKHTMNPFTDSPSSIMSSISSSSSAPPVVQLVELHQLVKLMQQDSDFDFRSMVLFTSSEDQNPNDNNDDNDDDGGGGDFPVKAEEEDMVPEIEMYENIQCTPYVSMGDDDNYSGYSSLMPI